MCTQTAVLFARSFPAIHTTAVSYTHDNRGRCLSRPPGPGVADLDSHFVGNKGWNEKGKIHKVGKPG